MSIPPPPASSLDDDKLVLLGTDIRSDPSLAAEVASGANTAIRDHYNEVGTPFSLIPNGVTPSGGVIWCLRSQLSQAVIMASIDASSEYDAIDTKGLTWLLSTFVQGVCFPFPPNIRESWVKIFAAAPNSRNEVLANSTRNCTRAEGLYCSPGAGPGGGNGSSQTACVYLGWEGLLTATDVTRALDATA